MSTYCMTTVRENETAPPEHIALVCYEWETDSLIWAYVIIMIVSLPFLVATIIVYSVIPALRDLSGKCIIGYVASMTVSYATMIARNFAPQLTFELCSIRGAVLYYSTISTFAWLNLVTFNVWKSVRNKVYQISDEKLFRYYLLWGVGVPLLLCGIVILLDVIPGSSIRGHFSMFDCWFHDSMGFWALFYAPMALLILLNIYLFIHCCWILWRGYRDPTQDRIRFLRFKCILTLRLFLLSGVPWIFDIISFSLEGVVELRYLWFVFDCINSGQGIVIFILLVACHKRVLRAIHSYKLCGLKWPDSWGQYEADSVAVSEIDKVAMEQMKQNNS
ncbi:UNVERIFIED_CONTAM: hypothetical protein PYX00_007489 [Menopon gallinae]|uniref:G-protein coupled receptors family 2 profile 2 domain-containing protein n=1 Tax=Menopon gallinae TaxID=328185 RepID=A0AAW2HJJ3_9NEOP